MPFEIRVHPGESIVEVVYPDRPTAAEVATYVTRVRRIIDELSAPWACLVDQRKLVVMPPDLVETVAQLNAYAEARGMQRSARVVKSAVAQLQTTRMAREASLTVPARTFEARDAALAWLREGVPRAARSR